MVWRDGLLPEPNTYGPFATREEAEEFDRNTPGNAWHGVYDAAAKTKVVSSPAREEGR